MIRKVIAAMTLLALATPASAQERDPARAIAPPAKVYVIPLRETIGKPALFILRRGLKEAIHEGADTVILDMKTPGGALDVTLQMMEALDKFPGKKVTYVNDEAISAGAMIASVTDEIHFAPKATMGAAEVILSSGEDVGEGLKRKLNSYMRAKIRSYSEDNPNRADVIRAMMDPDFEFKLGDLVIKPEGELLSLTATEAIRPHGEPPSPLLGTSIAENLDHLVRSLHGEHPSVRKLKVTWSERAAQYLSTITPVLLGLGILALIIEFKTPGFGIFGIAGITLITIVFLGQYVAGLSGHEPLLFFLLGAGLVMLEVLLMPGMMIGVITGIVLMLGSLIWAMLDHWPDEAMPPFGGGALTFPLAQVLGGFLIALGLFFTLLRFLPKTGPLGGMVLHDTIGGVPATGLPLQRDHSAPKGIELIGRTGKAATALFPSGQVEIEGHRYEARMEIGFAHPGTGIRVIGTTEFGLIVENLI